MISFKNDYNTLAAPKIIDALVKHQSEKNIGYGEDYHTANVKMTVRRICNKDVDSYLLTGGTQTNVVALCQMLQMPYEAVISVESGHINVHETGALEGQGRKILTTNGVDGKITPEEIKEVYSLNSGYHMVMPKAVYISNSTEIGTIYTKKELVEIKKCCEELGLYLFMDGARLPSALTACNNDLTMEDIAAYTDMFYLGGTKCGLPIGELLIISNDKLKLNMKYLIKNKTALLAKGFFSGILFEAFLDNNYYLELAAHENKMAEQIRNAAKDRIYYNNPTNQVFLRLTKEEIKTLEKEFLFEDWCELENGDMVMRFVTSYATKQEEVDALVARFKEILK